MKDLWKDPLPTSAQCEACLQLHHTVVAIRLLNGKQLTRIASTLWKDPLPTSAQCEACLQLHHTVVAAKRTPYLGSRIHSTFLRVCCAVAYSAINAELVRNTGKNLCLLVTNFATPLVLPLKYNPVHPAYQLLIYPHPGNWSPTVHERKKMRSSLYCTVSTCTTKLR